MTRSAIGQFEHVVLLAILRLGDAAYAPALLEELEGRPARPAVAGSMYATLDVLEEKGLLRSRLTDADGERGGHPRRYVSVTAYGLRELRASRKGLPGPWSGLG